MPNKVELKGSFIIIDGESFKIGTEKYDIALSFSSDYAFAIERFCNKQGERQVEYVTYSQPFAAIKLQEEHEEDPSAKLHEFNTILTEKEGSKEYIIKDKWSFISAAATEELQGNVPVLKLTVKAGRSDCIQVLNLLVFPKTGVIRYWFDLENPTDTEASYFVVPFAMNIAVDNEKDTYDACYLYGAACGYTYGKLVRQGLRGGLDSMKIEVGSGMNYHRVPMVLFEREEAPNDGIMFEMDCLMPWGFTVEKRRTEITLTSVIENCHDVRVVAKSSVSTPIITVATYSGDMDNLMVELYSWQYEYMWDYTHNDYFARFRDQSGDYPWVYCSRVLNEQYAYRLVGMDLLASKQLAKAGIDINWDDAGWSSFPGWPEDKYHSVFQNTYEGPDHRLSTRYFNKTGLKRLIWFARRPSLGILGTKEGAWGEFEWRTDGIGAFPDLYTHWRFMNGVKNYLEGGLNRSFHTCSCGATYAFNFDIQRYANFHYASDSGFGPCKAYYYSYFTVSDRFGDLLPGMGGHNVANDGSHMWTDTPRIPLGYTPEHAYSGLATCGLTGSNTEEHYVKIREDKEIYDWLKANGLVGRWMYMFHPGVYGDKEIYYQQRTSRDRLRACLIIRRTPKGRVVVYPKGLIADETYTVSFERNDTVFQKTGAELMEEGIVLKNVAPRELVYFNLQNSPARRKTANVPVVKNVVCAEECNVGMTGMGIYWSAEAKDVRYYEIARNGKVINTVAKLKYYFDNECDLKENPQYTVRAVGFADTVGEWVKAKKLTSIMPVYSTLGSHGEDMQKANWSAETSLDLKEFTPMRWTKAEFPGADFGGTPNQEGGIEGVFEGGQCAKIGRGWAQASPDCYCVRTFTVPQDGNITLTGRAVKEYYHSSYGADVEVSVMHNNSTIVPFTTLKCGDLDGLSYNQTLDVKKGDRLCFVVGKCDSEKNCNTHYEKDANLVGWNTIIAYNGDAAAYTDFAVRINCGGEDYTDQSGRLWAKDCYCINGDNYSTDKDINTLYKTAKKGDVEYKVPVKDGVYAVRLCFAETEYNYANERFMTISINGSTVETGMDIIHDVRGKDKEFSKVYRYIVPNENSEIDITLSNDALICGIEIVPENDDVIHVNCGGEDFVDWAGFVWNGDRYFAGGESVTDTCDDFHQASPTLYDKSLYMTGRMGEDISYEIPVKEGIYSVQLKFTELEIVNEGERPIDIYINNILVKENWDALSYSMEKRMSADIRFEAISSANGKINIRVVAKRNNPAILRAIEIDS